MKRKFYTTIFAFVLISSFWVFNATASNYYWVGGTGNWSQYSSHWATTSGGNTFQSQVPQSVDNVFFDANSFTSSGQTVTIDQTIVNCLNMDWTGVTHNPVINGSSGSNSLYVYGSLKLVPGMSYTFGGTVSFQATTTGQTIATANQTLGAVDFEGIGGDWTLQDALTVSGIFILTNGTFSTNNFNVSCGNIQSLSNNNRGFNFGSSTITMTNGGSAWNISSGNLSFNAGTSTLFFPSGGYFSGGTLAYYNLTFSNGCYLSTNNSTYNDVNITGGGYVLGSNTFNNLTLNGSPYILGGGSTITILNSFNVSGTCGSLVFIHTGTPGTAATIKKTSGNVTVNYVDMQDVNATGGATFTANNAIDGGNNTGWTVNQVASRNIYWVGGTGNWSDGNHWSLISGGTGSGCPPTPVDNVFFDVNSFTAPGQTVTVDATTANCNDMNWTGASNNPTFTGSNALQIYGSLTLTQPMTNTFSGPIYFQATTTGKTITSASNAFKRTLYFNGIGGEWTLLDSLTVNDEINFVYGTLTTNNQNVRCYDFMSNYFSNIRTLNLGSSVITITGAGPGASPWWVYSGGITLNAGTSTIIMTYSSGFSFMGAGLTYYDVSFASGSSLAQLDGNAFHDVYFAGGGWLAGNSTYNNLTFSAGKVYTLGSNTTQTINGNLNATGNCASVIFIKSYTSGSQATIKRTSGSISVDYVYLKDIKATGGATFTATNTTDGGNNSGWTIAGTTPRNYYWVGGTGNWSDGSHWSLTSGGTGSGCLPGPTDNVYFDSKSFTASGQAVSVDVNSAYCADMDWTGATKNPTLTASLYSYSTSLYIYGSLKLIPAMTYSYSGMISFEATTTGKTVTTAAQKMGVVQFNGTGGGWTLQDSLNSTFVFMLHGTINTNDQTVRAGEMQTNTLSSNCTLNMGASTIIITAGNNSWYSSDPITINAGTSLILLTDTTGNTNYFAGGSHTFYDVTFASPKTDAEIQTGINTFHNLTFYCNAKIPNSQNYGSLFFYNPGQTVIIAANSTQTISAAGQFYALGTGSHPIRIQSLSPGTQYTFLKTAGSVCLDYVRLSDSKATGGATFNAGANSQDLGGNTGWSFTGGGGGNPTVSITSSQPTGICNGSNVTFTAVPGSGGTATFDWHVNSTSKQNTSSATYSTSSLSNNDSVYCIMTVSASCLSSNTATSNKIPVTLVSNVTPSVSISPIQPSVCSGTQLTFTATPVHGGTTPSYQWQKNGTIVGVDSVQFSTSTLHNNDTITCILTSNENCVTPTTATSNKAIAVVNPSALSGTVTAVPSAVCSGQSSQLSVTGSQGTLQWQSSPNGTLFTDIPAASSTSYNASNITQTTYFRVKASSTCGVDSSDTPIAVHVASSYTAGTISAPHNALCDGATDTLAVTGNSGAIQWQSSSTSANFTDIAGEVNSTYLAQPSQTTYYRVFAGSGACADSSAPFALSVHPLPDPPALSVTPDTIICASDSAHICAPNGFSAYLWNDNSTGACTYARNAGGYWVNVTDGNGCSNSSSHASITVYPVSSVAIVANGDTLSSFNGKAYQWYANDTVITGANNSYYVSPGKGSYAVEITDTNGCKARSSSIALAINDLSTDAPFNIYPNPANNEVFIVINSATSYSDICLLNMLGQEVKRIPIQPSINTTPLIDVTNIAAGIYLVNLIDNGQLIGSKRLVKE